MFGTMLASPIAIFEAHEGHLFDQQDGDSLLAKARESVEDRLNDLGSKTEGRLVKEQQPRLCGEYHLLLAAAQKTSRLRQPLAHAWE
jgi:hypothetical protein